MRLVFLGLMYSDSLLEQIRRKKLCRLQMAPHTFGTNLMRGFLSEDEVSMFLINVPPMGSYPFASKKLLLKCEKWGEGKNYQPGYINLPLLKIPVIRKQIKERLTKIIHTTGEDTALILYSLYEPFLDAAIWAKKKYPKLGIYLLQTDCVPGREDMEKYMTPRAVKRGNRLVEKAKCVDGFVVLTKYLPKQLEVGDRPFCVVECVCDSSQEPDPYIENKKICLYTGSLSKEFGLFELTEAFKTIDDAELWVCGGGELQNYLVEASNKHKNIKFFGFVTQQQIAKIRKNANFLINPRRPSGTYTKHSFPSKTAEYMASGKPVIMYKLEGIPDEYDAYLNYLTESSPEKIATELKSILDFDYEVLCEKAREGSVYIRKNASPQSQARKIINLIREDHNSEGFAD